MSDPGVELGFSPDALDDLSNVLAYSLMEYGETQMMKYRSALEGTFQ